MLQQHGEPGLLNPFNDLDVHLSGSRIKEP
jgi:hypothetical protein